MIAFPAGAKVWTTGGVTDMRCGMNSLALKVQQGLGRDTHGGEVFCFRGRRGDLVKILWHDGIGMSLYSLAHVATMIEENRELLEVVAANPDDITYGEMIHIIDGTEERVTAFTARGIESLQEFLEDVRSWPGGILQFRDCQEFRA